MCSKLRGQMRLPEYIKQLGDRKFAKLVKVTPRTAASWRRMERRPKAEKAQEIVEKTPVTMEGIYGA
jgi:hypothetical protein